MATTESTDHFARTEFADNPEPRCPVVLLLDTSASMSGEPIDELNNGLQSLAQELREDRLASLRVEVAEIVTFGDAVEALDVRGGGAPVRFDGGAPLADLAYYAFVTADRFQAPVLRADGGQTPLGAGMWSTLGLVTERKTVYKMQGLDYYRPWVFLVSDGEPTDRWQEIAEMAIEEERRNGLMIFPIGVQGANLDTLGKFSTRPPLMLRGLAFRELFRWVSKSLSSVARSNPGDQIPLEPTAGWANIPTGV